MITVKNLNIFKNEDIQNFALKAAGLTSLSSICGYGGTFFFTALNPNTGAAYLASVALISYVAYEILGKFKEVFSSENFRYGVMAAQLLQIPFWFYVLPELLKLNLQNAVKLEIVIVTAHFVAIPVFFHLAIKSWNDPTLTNIASAAGVMLSLGNGLRSYI